MAITSSDLHVARAPLAARDLGPADLACTGPNTPAGRYMRRFWHPVRVAKDLPAGRAVPIRIMGEDFTLYRGESGRPQVVAFRCAHRGTQLSTGWVEGDCIRCFYHGWRYDASGQCVEQPAEDAGFADKVRIASYPTREYLGLLFAYFGEGAPPPLPRYPAFEGDGILVVRTIFRPYNFFNSLDNGPDPVHVAFAHSNSAFYAAGLQGVPEVSAEETCWGLTVRAKRANGVRVTHAGMPNLSLIKGSPDDEEVGWTDQLAWRVPIDDVSHHSFNINYVHLTGAAAEEYLKAQEQRKSKFRISGSVVELGDAVLRGEITIEDLRGHPNLINIQDHVAQAGQGPIADRTDERLGRSDVGVILRRKLWLRELRALAEGQPLTEWSLGGLETQAGA